MFLPHTLQIVARRGMEAVPLTRLSLTQQPHPVWVAATVSLALYNLPSSFSHKCIFNMIQSMKNKPSRLQYPALHSLRCSCHAGSYLGFSCVTSCLASLHFPFPVSPVQGACLVLFTCVFRGAPWIEGADAVRGADCQP